METGSHPISDQARSSARCTDPEIATIVESYVSSPPIPHQSPDTTGIRRDFLNAFFDGFTSPGAQMASSNNAAYHGFVAGHDYHSENPNKEEEVMRAFGYDVVSIKGRLFFGQEAGFSPHMGASVRWEVADTALRIDAWPPKSQRKEGMNVIVKAYLSPEIYYGQRFNGDRKLYLLHTEVLSQ